jgi:hypothetical protein
MDNRKMRARDASWGDRGSGGDLDTLTDGTSVPGNTTGTEAYSEHPDSDAYGATGGRRAGDPLPDSGGPDVTDMGENEPNAGYGQVDAGGS